MTIFFFRLKREDPRNEKVQRSGDENKRESDKEGVKACM